MGVTTIRLEGFTMTIKRFYDNTCGSFAVAGEGRTGIRRSLAANKSMLVAFKPDRSVSEVL